MFDTWNHSLFHFFNAEPDTPYWALLAGQFIAGRIIYALPVLLVALWLWGTQLERQTALKALTVTAGALALNMMIGWYLPMDRPFVLGIGHQWLDHAATPSFPSNHLSIFMGVGVSLLLGHTPRLGAVVLVCGVVVAWARMFVGVHYPMDMLGSLLTASLAYVLITPLWARIGPAVTRQLERLYRWLLAPLIALGWIRP